MGGYKMKFWTLILSILTLASVSSFARGTNNAVKSCVGQMKYGENSDYVLQAQNDEIKIMSYNVENLFDTIHDEGRDDYEFLPLSSPEKAKCEFKQGYYKEACKRTDWTDDRLAIKLDQIKRVVEAQGELPDVMAVLEVENVNVVSQLADHLGYPKFLVTSGEDKRIELAIMYKEDKIKLKEMKEVKISFPSEIGIKTTRNILVANFVSLKNKNEVLGFYVNHWPSQASPSAARVTAAKFIRKTVDQFSKKYGTDAYHVVAMGDFNTIEKDNPRPFDVISDNNWENKLEDLEQVYRTSAYKNDPNDMINKMAPSTYYYSGDHSWNHLDHMFISANLLDGKGVDVMAEYFRIVAPNFILKTVTENSKKRNRDSDDSHACVFSAPKRYFHNATTPEAAGFSDHMPLLVKIKL